MKMRLIFLTKLGAGLSLLASTAAAMSQPLAVSTMDAQLISYFRPYAPAAEVLTNKVEKQLPAATRNGDKADTASKSATASKPVGDNQLCCENNMSKATDADSADGKLPKMPQLN